MVPPPHGWHPARQHPVPARRCLLRGRSGHAPGADLTPGARARAAGLRGRLPARAGTSVSGRTRRCAGSLPRAARRRPGDPGRRFGRRRAGPGHGAGAARRGRPGPGGAGAVLALGGPGHTGCAPAGAAGRGDAGLALDQRLRAALRGRRRRGGRWCAGLPHASAGLAAAGGPAGPAAGADPGRHRRTAARAGAGAARRAAGGRRRRTLRDHAPALACVPAARQRPAQRRRRDRPRGAFCPGAAGGGHAPPPIQNTRS